MRILHTSDWHLGRALYSKNDRQDEHRAFLNWLHTIIAEQSIDLVLIAGDIFDTSAPNSTSQKLYYDFLINVRQSGCKNIVVVGGNHDSPSFLNAPRTVLSALNIAVVGNVTDKIEDEVIVIKDELNTPILIVCAVPFIRERDISRFTDGETYGDQSKRINEGIRKHYEYMATLADAKRKELGIHIPVVATGHLSVAGGKRNDDDGVRETYVGNIQAVGSDIFPETFDYVALGHYHIPSSIKDHIRYCGSPIPMGFGEAGQKKCVYVIDFSQGKHITTIEVPVFQKIESISGDKTFIAARLHELRKTDSSVWTEIIYTGEEMFPNLSEWVRDQVANSDIEILKIQNRTYLTDVLSQADTTTTLDQLDPAEVFEKLLSKSFISEDEKPELTDMYREIIQGMHINNEQK
jgi:exonuclease SbcD